MSAGSGKQVIERPRVQEERCNRSDNGQLIDTLPPELFVQILDTVYRLHRRSGIGADNNWTVPYQLVCRRWRDAIRSTPHFWQQIDVCSSPKWLEFCLTRCAGAPASVDLWEPTSPDETFATLCRHASSIGACYLHCDVAYMWYLSGLPSLLATPMPALETLALVGPYHEDEILDVSITHNRVPCLTTLDLWNCTAPSDIGVYTSLRRLTFLGTTWTISYDDFLDVMGDCRNLEYLRLDEQVLDEFAEELANHPTRQQCRTTPLVVPRLKTMVLSGQREVLLHFLATIHAPQATTIELKDCVDDDEPGPLVSRLLAPNPQLRYPFLSSSRDISVCCWDGNPFKLTVRCGADSKTLFSVDYGMVHNELWPGNAYLEHNLVAVMDLFSVASVDTLEVEGCLNQIPVQTWQRVFETFSCLRTLHINGRGTLDSLWSGLSCATRAELEYSGAACCSSLSEIGVDERPLLWGGSRVKFLATATLFEIVRNTLRARAGAGAARLKRLQLHLEYPDELWDQTAELREAFVEDVKVLVDDLDYHDGRTSLEMGPGSYIPSMLRPY